ncbi:helix-turn-helix transcriptional regulator [Phytoactinopolyspora mesophila]|uniref:Helix-turn-helix domain-containing protein n=1 Tax=Phytoactinopolyspora mesophila TaxID=2650750 RepID=A0A7K3MCR4_9ACTN|nr:helix-turn-helix domain-containing protein [Phytoactinopolyspora mesophila]NDL60837.1 helix-turn-helix domain-containing protein [Phytoactinopolyspora mesophila]
MAAIQSTPHRQPRRHLTVADICEELGISRSTFYEWRAKKTAPPCIKLPNGELRVRAADLDAWIESWTEHTA